MRNLNTPMSFVGNLLVVLAVAISASPAIAASATPLTKEQISQKIIGKTLKAKRMGMPVRILYKIDGTITMKAPFMSGSGTWTFNDNGICMRMTRGPRLGRNCITFQYLGGNKYRNSKGLIFTVQG